MRKVLLELLVIILTTVITTIGFTGILFMFNCKLHEYYIFIPSMIISWFVFLPLFFYWSTLFKRIFKINKDVE